RGSRGRLRGCAGVGRAGCGSHHGESEPPPNQPRRVTGLPPGAKRSWVHTARGAPDMSPGDTPPPPPPLSVDARSALDRTNLAEEAAGLTQRTSAGLMPAE